MQQKTDRLVTEEVKSLLKDLISFRSTGDRSDELKKLANFVIDYFRGIPVFIDRYQFSDKPALVITTRKTRQPKIFFQGHLDVVDGNDDQFLPEEKGDRLYGRGAVDMKGFDAIALHLIRETALAKKDYDIGIMLTFDEEIGSENGAKRLSEMDYSCNILINGDGGYNYKLIYAEKGILKFKLSVEATPGRHPYPWQGENAFDILIRNYNKIIALFPDQEVATDNDNWYTTYSTYDVNVENDALFPPKKAELKMNVYFTEPLSVENYFAKIQAVLDNRVTFSPITGSERVYLNPETPVFLEMQHLLEKYFNRQILPKAENGSSDARFFTGRGFPILVLKVVGEGHHTFEEYLHIPSIAPLYRVLEKFVERHGRTNSESIHYKNQKEGILREIHS